jgi:hypothetical protein
MVRVLAWDVGIKNLAYCLINADGTKNDCSFEIEKWGIINLNNETDDLYCTQKIKSGEKCTSKAKFLFTESGTTEYYCDKHKNCYKPVNINSIDNKDGKCEYMTKGDVMCNKKSCKQLDEINNNNILCKTHFTSVTKVLGKQVELQKIEKKNSNKLPMKLLAEKLFMKLDEKMGDFMTADCVKIENQPSMINPTMKTISSLMYSYFIIRGITDKNKNNSKIMHVDFISPSNKLKMYCNDINKLIKKDRKKSDQYAITKTLSEKACKIFIENDKENTILLGGYKKQDDLCDAFLHGYYNLFGEKVNDNIRIKFDEIMKENKLTSEKVVKVKKNKSDKNVNVKDDVKNDVKDNVKDDVKNNVKDDVKDNKKIFVAKTKVKKTRLST